MVENDDAVVKVDAVLLKKIEEVIKKDKYRYSSKKQVVNLAIIEFLNAEGLNKNKKKKIKKENKGKRGK